MAEGYIARQLPISVIVIDFFHWVHQVGQIAMSKGLGEKKSRAIGVLTDGVGPTQSRWLTGRSTIIVKKTIGLKYFYQSFPDWLKMGSS